MDYHGYTVYANGDIMGKFGKMLKPATSNMGYLVVGIHIDKKKHTMKVHRLVALCYIPNPDNKPTVDHILCKEITNNNVSNLRWATRLEQMTNQSIRRNNTSGVKGVKKNGNSWIARLDAYRRLDNLLSNLSLFIWSTVKPRGGSPTNNFIIRP